MNSGHWWSGVLVNLAAIFIVDRRRRREFRNRHREDRFVTVRGKGNQIVGRPADCRVCIWGDGNRIEFQSPCAVFLGTINVGSADCPANGCSVVVGPRTASVGTTMWIMEDGSSVRIGADCLISREVQLWCSDTHAIMDAGGNVLNAGPHAIAIGDRCWIGYGVHVMKGVELPAGSIVGLGSVVAGRHYDQPHCAYAGNPARLVRKGVRWDIARPKAMLRRQSAPAEPAA